MTLPDIAVCIPTYQRPQIVKKTVLSLMGYLQYLGDVDIFVSVDGKNHQETFAELTKFDNVCVVQGPNKGLGANLNHLLRLTQKYQLTMFQDDDHILKMPLNLTPHAKLLMTDERAGWVRLYWCTGHHFVAELLENYWYVKWDSPFLYVTSFRPHLKHRRFHNTFGRYPEGLKLGETEERFCHQCRDRAKLLYRQKDVIPQVVIPLTYKDFMFDHVGDSWQAKGH